MTQLKLGEFLEMERCPHCSVYRPQLAHRWGEVTADHARRQAREWATFLCSRCGGVVLVASVGGTGGVISEIYPTSVDIDDAVPARAREYLSQARESVYSPAGAVMLCASAVDAMLKAKAFKTGSLSERIDQAAAAHLITSDMAAWAHDVRLDANDQRHSDEAVPMPELEDAQRCLEFTVALGEVLFVLPARVRRGLRTVTSTRKASSAES